MQISITKHIFLLKKRWIILPLIAIIYVLIVQTRLLTKVHSENSFESENLIHFNIAAKIPPFQIANGTDTNTNVAAKNKHAYVFLIAGCNPRKPSYRGYILNILIATEILRSSGSKNDVVVMVRLSSSHRNTALPQKDEDMLKAGGVIIRYIPKVKEDNFYTAMIDKFRVLEMIEYSRVLFLDSDVMPYCNIDYMTASTEGPNATLLENVVIKWRSEPAAGAFFILRPDLDDYAALLDIVAKKEKVRSDVDKVMGWGRNITSPDYWQAVEILDRRHHYKWDWYGVFADQGLLYYYTKYYKKRVSIIGSENVEHWSEPNSTITMQINEMHKPEVILDDLQMYSRPDFTVINRPCPSLHKRFKGTKSVPGHVPYSDYYHFTQKFKPWVGSGPNFNISSVNEPKNPSEMWWKYLVRLKERHNYDFIPLDFELFKKHLGGKPSLGFIPTHHQVHTKAATDGYNQTSY
mmetsp:Transcript_49739/g.58038  ORF Transcript_49739/g.58038 Transcript_49739/m.58038 type:complete len:463 (-) Transcript_49739:29-1417(-)